jgi:hypothetical protein
VDVSNTNGNGCEWTIHVENGGSFTVEVSNEIPLPYSYTSQNQNVKIPSYPPYPPPQTIVVYTNESHAIAATVTVSHAPAAGSTFVDSGVTFGSGPAAGANLIFVPSGFPGQGQYSVNKATGVYSFNALDVISGWPVLLSYSITTPSAGVLLPAATYIIGSTPNQLVMAKSDLNVKWVRIRQATPGTTVAFLHVGK